jgi:thioredoxin 1
MLDRRSFIGAAGGCALLLAAGTAIAATPAPFTEAAFRSAKAAGKPILVEVSAPWCPTCKAQKPILSELTSRPEFAGLVVLDVDFDSQKDVVRALGARTQSTLIVFKSGEEVGRSVGDTDPASIEALLRSAL